MKRAIEILTKEKEALTSFIDTCKEASEGWEEICKEDIQHLSEVEAALNLISSNPPVIGESILTAIKDQSNEQQELFQKHAGKDENRFWEATGAHKAYLHSIRIIQRGGKSPK